MNPEWLSVCQLLSCYTMVKLKNAQWGPFVRMYQTKH